MDGILVIDKPRDWTSHDVVIFVKKRLKAKKAGHTGTLDPMATGVLVVLVGKYTKRAEELIGLDKEYKAVLTLGSATDTGDSTGRIIRTMVLPQLGRPDVENILKDFTGQIEQVPPMYSALSYKGRRLYEFAREGKHIERPSRKITIKQLNLDSFDLPDISLGVVCSKGTYIRTLCEDIAGRLGTAGHMSYLRRIRCGRFSIAQAVTVEGLKEMTDEDLKRICAQNQL